MSDGFDLNNGARRQAKDILAKEELGLGKPLERFAKARRVPSVKDVLRHLFYQMKDMKKRTLQEQRT